MRSGRWNGVATAPTATLTARSCSMRACTRTSALVAGAGGASFSLPAAASAKIIEIGEVAAEPTPSCPTSPCEVISRTTAFQTRAIGKRATCSSRRRTAASSPGRSRSARPETKQQQVLRGEPRRRRAGRHHRAQGRAIASYGRVLGAEPAADAHAVLRPDGPVPAHHVAARQQGLVVALTVPTWAPALGARPGPRQRLEGEPRHRRLRRHPDAERADRPATTSRRYKCAYRTARLTYSATLITTPKPPEPPKKPTT